jgi:hypothetical protein
VERERSEAGRRAKGDRKRRSRAGKRLRKKVAERAPAAKEGRAFSGQPWLPDALAAVGTTVLVSDAIATDCLATGRLGDRRWIARAVLFVDAPDATTATEAAQPARSCSRRSTRRDQLRLNATGCLLEREKKARANSDLLSDCPTYRC